MQKCWVLENNNTNSGHRELLHDTIATPLFYIVCLSDFNKRNGIHSLILHEFTQNLGEFRRLLKQVQTLGYLSLVCVMCSRLIPPKSPRFD